MTDDVTKQDLLELLDAMDNEQFKLDMLEALGCLVLCIHWLRGTFNWLMYTGAVEWSSEKDKANYERLFGNIELYEQIIWELVPSRAMLVEMRNYRKTSVWSEGFEALLAKDGHGRIPYDVQPHTIDDIHDLLRRLGAARTQRAEDFDVQGKT